MTQIKNIFAKGTVQKDLDSRFVSPDELIDAENAIVITSEGSNAGVLKNVTGNIRKTFSNIVGAKTIGHGVLSSKNKVYNFIAGSAHDYIIETDVVAWNSVIVAQSSVGQLLNFNRNKRITNVDIIIDPEGGGDILLFSGNNYPLRCLNIDIAKTWTINGFTETQISLMKPSPIFAPDINLTTSVDGIENNFIEDKFICFAYRYKYVGGFYSAPSSWSRIAFQPRNFLLNFQTNENNGMLNVANAVDVSFNTGSVDVVAVDLLFRESDHQTIYVIEQFDKIQQRWADNTIQQYQFSKSKIFSILSEDQFFRNFDNVPLEAVAQSVIGSRIAYGNFLEGRNIEEKIDFEVSLNVSSAVSDEKKPEIVNFVDIAKEYPNLVDFVEGISDGGEDPVDQMDYLTNTIEVDLPTVDDTAFFSIDINPKPGYDQIPYNVYIKDGATILDSWTNISGSTIKIYSTTTNVNAQIYVTSALGFMYECKLTYLIRRDTGVVLVTLSQYNYFAYIQLSYPNSTGFPSTLVGDTVIDIIAEFDLTGVIFTKGKQLLIDFELKSSLVDDFFASLTFFYFITEDYPDLATFIANSSFKQQLEVLFSLNFRNNYLSNAGPIVSYEGFLLSVSGNIISITTPKVVYTVTEPSEAVEEKKEFYLITDALFYSTTENGFASRHSNRDNEVGVIYMDGEGRKSTVLVCSENSIHIPVQNSDKITVLSVKIKNNPPSWAKYYKFAIKQTSRNYETIYGNVVYADGVFRWIKLIGGDKAKVSEVDLLTLKKDYSGALKNLVKVKVLEVAQKEANFISGNFISIGTELLEESGLYFKIKQGNFDINITKNDFLNFYGRGERIYASRSFVNTEPIFGIINESDVYVPYEIKAGSRIRFYVSLKSLYFDTSFLKEVIAQDDYADMQEWFNTEIEILDDWNSYANANLKDWRFTTDGKQFGVKSKRDGNEGPISSEVITEVSFNVNFSNGTLVFETEPIVQLNSSFFETPETFTITNGRHEFTDHVLNDAFNCFSFGNGVESYKIRDSITGDSFSVDSNPNGVNIEGYQQVRRFKDITWSEVFNSNTNINRLNEFNLSNGNFKDDMETSYGPIYKMRGKDTNLEVCQEDRDSIVFYGKDMLFNADGTTNLSRIQEVLGQQKVYDGEYGISTHADSYDYYENTSYHTDFKRGVVVKKGGNGLFEISALGMRTYFKKLFRDNTINEIIGRYDQFYDYYLLNIKYTDKDGVSKYVTWAFSDKVNGWLTRLTFNPEDMCRVNSQFISFKSGEIYLHNQDTLFNTFYGVESDTNFKFNFSQEPSTRKIHKAISIEGTTNLQIACETDLEKGYVNKSDFEWKEGVWYAYVRGKNGELNTSQLSFQGIGEATIVGLTLQFIFELDSIISVGDVVLNSNLQIVGTILRKTANSLTLDTVNNIVSGGFVLASKPESVEKQGIMGYFMQVDASFSSNTQQEIYALNAEVIKSYI